MYRKHRSATKEHNHLIANDKARKYKPTTTTTTQIISIVQYNITSITRNAETGYEDKIRSNTRQLTTTATALQKILVQQYCHCRCRHCHCHIRPVNCLTRAAAILNANRMPNASSSSDTQRKSLARPTSPLPVAILNADRLRGTSLSIVDDLLQHYNYSIAKR